MSSAGELKTLLLRAPRRTIAVAESLTAGFLQSAIASVSGASGFFLGGVSAYNIDQKVRLLGVDRASARRVDCVSAEIAAQMAQGVARLFGSALGLATTGYAEPAPDHDILSPFAWWALVERRRGRVFASRAGRVECPGATRVEAQQMVAGAALAELVAYLRETGG